MPTPPAVRIVYGPTGGRFPLMFGIAHALETALGRMGIKILDRVGISGGAIVAAVRASNRDFEQWLTQCDGLGKHCSLLGWKTPAQLWRYFVHGGLLNSKKVLESTFQKLIPHPPTEPCWAISWCKSADKPVAFNLTNNPLAATMVLASAAVPIAFSPVEIPNASLSDPVKSSLEVDDTGVSTFIDGGLSDVFPARLIDKEVVPTIMVFIDNLPLAGEEPPKDMWDKVFGMHNKSYLLAQSARRKKTTQIFVVPAPAAFDRYRLRFDIPHDEAMTMYHHGRVMAEHSFRLMLPMSDLPEHLDQENGDGEADTDERLRGEQTFIQVVHCQEREDQVAQTVSEQANPPQA